MINTVNPLVSILLLTYNQEELVIDALSSLLNQDYPNFEIIISDDHSTDRTVKNIKDFLKNQIHHIKISLLENDRNLGLCGNINSAIQHCTGELIFLAAGDDISLKERCSTIVNTWLSLEKKPLLIASDAYDMSFQGEILGIKRTSDLSLYKNLKDWIDNPPYFFGSSHVWSKNLVLKYPRIPDDIGAEDHLMIFRAILHGAAITINKPLVKHRRGGMTARTFVPLEKKIERLKKGYLQNLAYYRQLIEDAKSDRHSHILEQHVQIEKNRAEFAIKLFAEKNKWRMLLLTLKTHQVSLFIRLRLLTYLAFPILLQPVFFLKQHLKKY